MGKNLNNKNEHDQRLKWDLTGGWTLGSGIVVGKSGKNKHWATLVAVALCCYFNIQWFLSI